MIGVIETVVDNTYVVNVTDVAPDPDQPRKIFNKKKLSELAESILEFGQREPIKVVDRTTLPDYKPGTARWMINDGERRWRAINLLGLKTIRMKVISAGTAGSRFIQSATANFGREGHTPMEAARAVARVLQEPEFASLGVMEAERRVAALFTRSTAWVRIQKRLMMLAPEVQDLIEGDDNDEKETLNAQVALSLLAIKDEAKRIEVAKTIVTKKLGKIGALAAIRNAQKSHGVSPGSYMRHSEDVQRIGRFTKRIQTNADGLLELKLPDIRAYLGSRQGEKTKIVNELTAAKEALEILINAFSK